ncbi:MAG: dienelactone hydrolase family protein, partial [Oscillospiraceae bacterium]|nr:dienelactone hydrolase family protein [Oscillospiraceae bacterium]
GSVVCPPDRLSPKQPVAPVDLADGIDCPLLGIFGNEDRFPPPADVDTLEAVLKEKGKDYEFHRYDGAGHGFWYYDKPMYRQEQAMDSWNKVFAFFDKHLKEP